MNDFDEQTVLDIRQADQSDLPALIELYQHLAEGDEKPHLELAHGVFERFRAYSGSIIVIGLADGVLATSCTLVVIPNLTRGGRSYGLIENVVTHRGFRNRGFGKQILQHAADAAWKANCYKVMLMTGSKRREVLDFYLAAGFEQSKTGFQMRRLAARTET